MSNARPAIEYIARITCACGTVVEVPSYIYGHDPEMDCDMPDGWRGGYPDQPPMCPACVASKYA